MSAMPVRKRSGHRRPHSQQAMPVTGGDGGCDVLERPRPCALASPVDLQSDEVVERLREMAPELSVSGGSFERSLPHPASIPRGRRHAVLPLAQHKAVGLCLRNLLAAAGLPPVEPGHLPSGSRMWPAGHVGSVSHKGTRVVAVLGRRTSVEVVGVDIDDRREVPLAAGLPCEQPPEVAADCASAILFSVKEAVFKALHPVMAQPLRFDDVVTRWTTGPPLLLGTAHCRGRRLAVRCSLSVPSWVVSAAIRLVEPAAERKTGRAGPPEGPI